MGFFSNIKVAQAVPQEGVDPQQNLQNLEGSGFLGKALANAIRSGAITKVIAPVAAAQEAATASPAPATTSNAYTVAPQNLSIGRTSYRSLPANMLSRLSLASLKDILKRYEEEGEEVPRYADGGPVAGILNVNNPSLTPGGLISSSAPPVNQDDVRRSILQFARDAASGKVPSYLFPGAISPQQFLQNQNVTVPQTISVGNAQMMPANDLLEFLRKNRMV